MKLTPGPWPMSPRLVCTMLLLLLVAVLQTVESKKKAASRHADHCEKGTHSCHREAVCVNTRRSYKCKCKPGFYGDGKICKDDDECGYENGGCVHTCINTPGNFTCACKPGFALAPNGFDCQDTNECFHNKGGCQQQCVNTLGSYECRCSSGYSVDTTGTKCIHGQWCKIQLQCDHHCRVSPSGHGLQCYCRDGYQLGPDNKSCLRTCRNGNGGCQHICNDTANGPVCTCMPKYILNSDQTTCTASCSVNNGGCERKCMDTPTGPKCLCPPGFQLHKDKRSCLDVDECALGTAGCSHQCENTRGGFECICPAGYKVAMDHKTCIDIDECAANLTCDHTCQNIAGSFICRCRRGYQLYGKTHCADINECAVRNGGCQHTCENSEGSYTCSCNSGFKLHNNKHDCVDAAKCIPLRVPPSANLSCRNSAHQEQTCVLRCHDNAHFIGHDNMTSLSLSCGPSSRFDWTNLINGTLPSCSKMFVPPSFSRKAKFVFIKDNCNIDVQSMEAAKRNLTKMFNDEKKYKCANRCRVNYIDVKCGSRRKKFKRLVRRNKKALLTGELELQMEAKEPSGACDAQCVSERTLRKFNRAFKKLRRAAKRQKLVLTINDEDIPVLKKSFKPSSSVDRTCQPGTVFLNKYCVGCTVGSFFNNKSSSCEPCPRGTYQDHEGQLACKECPDRKPGSGMEGAMTLAQCSELCDPGYFSGSGSKPCIPCPMGTIQPDYGRTSCIPCGASLRTRGSASTSFKDCLVREVCKAGHFYDVTEHQCKRCERGYYQSETGQNFCVACPGQTSTDFDAAVSADDCKDRTCGKYWGEFYGVLESPNYPGDYPTNIECVWRIRPEKRRRILVIIPEIYLREEDACGDTVVMRKSKSPYSQSTFGTCESRDRPIAFTARSKKLWIQFKSNGNNTAGGFSIPFVTYNEEYQSLIEDIVRDGRLYSSKQHQQIFKDRQLLNALLEVIATPYNYLKYANVSHTMFPQSFFKLLTPKVRRFFST